MQELHCIVYLSSAFTQLSDQDLERLVDDARRFNESAEITGVLLYNRGGFFQYLEGPASGVNEVYERIRRSRVHHGIYELLNQPLAQRLFPRWFMGLSHAPASTMLELQNAEWHGVASGLARTNEAQNPGLTLLQTYWRANSNSL